MNAGLRRSRRCHHETHQNTKLRGASCRPSKSGVRVGAPLKCLGRRALASAMSPQIERERRSWFRDGPQKVSNTETVSVVLLPRMHPPTWRNVAGYLIHILHRASELGATLLPHTPTPANCSVRVAWPATTVSPRLWRHSSVLSASASHPASGIALHSHSRIAATSRSIPRRRYFCTSVFATLWRSFSFQRRWGTSASW